MEVYLSSHFFLRFLQVKHPVLLRIIGIGRMPEVEGVGFVGDIVDKGQPAGRRAAVIGSQSACGAVTAQRSGSKRESKSDRGSGISESSGDSGLFAGKRTGENPSRLSVSFSLSVLLSLSVLV